MSGAAAAAAIEERAALDLLFAVLRVDSIWGHERALAERLRADGFADVALVEPLPGRPSVVARIPGTGGGQSPILNGHIDIYELAADWTRDPFTPVVKDGRVYGAGVGRTRRRGRRGCWRRRGFF